MKTKIFSLPENPTTIQVISLPGKFATCCKKIFAKIFWQIKIITIFDPSITNHGVGSRNKATVEQPLSRKKNEEYPNYHLRLREALQKILRL